MKNIVFGPVGTTFIFIACFAIVAVIGLWAAISLKTINVNASLKYNMFTLQNKNIVIIIASKDFRDEEYFVTKEILDRGGAQIKTASNKLGVAIGADGGQVKAELLVSQVNPANFDAVVFIGGPGTLQYMDNEASYKLASDTVKNEKVLASICISPVILAKAGVLKGKKATVWSSLLDKSAVKILRDNGAIYGNDAVIIDGKIITANGPEAAKEFGQAIVKLLTTK